MSLKDSYGKTCESPFVSYYLIHWKICLITYYQILSIPKNIVISLKRTMRGKVWVGAKCTGNSTGIQAVLLV
jgi:hypothetical protein